MNENYGIDDSGIQHENCYLLFRRLEVELIIVVVVRIVTFVYEPSRLGKFFSISNNTATDYFSLIHIDLWGAYRTPSTCGAVYFLTIVDDFSKAVWVYLLLDKKEVEQKVKQFCVMVERQFHKSVRTVRSDNSTEFLGLKAYFAAHGILHQTSCVATP